MKKLLMLGAILAIGAMAYAKDSNPDGDINTSEASVTVKAELVAKNIEISDLEGNPLVLDFGKISKLRDKGTSLAEEGVRVRYFGELSDENKKLELSLKDGANGFRQKAVEVRLSELNSQAGAPAHSFAVTVGLNAYAGALPIDPADGKDYVEYTGKLTGTLDYDARVSKPSKEANPAEDLKVTPLAALNSGDYQGETVLKVTVGA